MILSFFLAIPGIISLHSENRRKIFPTIFYLAIGIYISIAILSFFSSGVLNFAKGETSDFWMSFAIPLTIFHYRTQEGKYWIPRFIILFFALLLVSGFASLFTPYRLGKWISHGFNYPDGERLQHFAGGIAGIGTYLPIGLMNTHLTYGGLLGMVSIGCLAFLFTKIQSIRSTLLFLLVLFLTGFLVFYNQSRSIWIGILFLAILMIPSLVLGRVPIFSRFHSDRKNIESTPRIKSYTKIGILFFALLIGSVGTIKIFESNWLIQRAVQDIFEKKTTENQRYFILKNSLSLTKDHWLLGVGNNQFRSQHRTQSETMIQEFPWLWYELEITPRGHAHHDFLHFAIVGGLPTGILWILFWISLFAYCIHLLYDPDKERSKSYLLGLGVLVLFPAGFFQCYMLDDEVVLPFYALVGFLVSHNNSKIRIRSWVWASSIVILLLSGSLTYWWFATKPSPDQVHQSKIDWTLDENTPVKVRIEGCLSHYFGKPIGKRKESMWIGIESNLLNTKNNPQQLTISLWDRDSFDQDQLYKAHESNLIVQKNVLITGGVQWIEFPESILNLDSDGFPGIVRFRDFEVEFSNWDKKIPLPAILISDICEPKIQEKILFN
jgi:O-antigen ligase